MSHGSFVFSSTALRSLQLEEDMLERDNYKKKLASRKLNGYLLKKEARDRVSLRSSFVLPPAICYDLVIQNALYTGDTEAVQRLFPRGSTANLIIEPQGGDMRWVSKGEETTLLKVQSKTAEAVFHCHVRVGSFSMATSIPAIKWRKQKPYRSDVIATAKATGCILQFWNCLLVGDDLTLISILDENKEYDYLIDATYDTSNVEEWKNFRFNTRGLRLWSLSYEQELTTPLHITAGRGFTDSLRLLLQRGANVELAPGGTTALHDSCETCHPECTKLLLSHGANANAVCEDGLMPLHMCTIPESFECAKHLLQFGAAITARSLEEDDTPLHIAAENGLPEHIELYLRYGAAVDKQNNHGLTPLNAACSEQQEAHELERYFKVCKLLVEAGSDVRTRDQDKETPLHMACKNANADVVDLLLTHGADVNAMNYGCKAPMHMILQMVCYKTSQQPERVVRSLLNYGSVLVWPVALPTVLKHCCMSPRTIEVLLNAYPRLKITDSWVEAISPEVFKEHQEFYESLFSLAQTPRSLQHLARVRLRTFLEGHVLEVVPKLNLPTFLKNYLLLDFRGYVH